MTRNATLADLKAAIAADTGVDAEQQQLDNTPEYLMLEGDMGDEFYGAADATLRRDSNPA